MVPLFEENTSEYVIRDDAGLGASKRLIYFSAGLNRSEQTKHDLYADTVWPGAVLMADALVADPALVADKRVIEVGSGQHALPSLVAAELGATDVLATDHPSSGILGTLPGIIIANGASRIMPCELDWTALHLPKCMHGRKFDTVLAAECLWRDTRALQPALAALVSKVASPSATLLVSWGDRLCDGHTADDNARFLDTLQDVHGWEITSHTMHVKADLQCEGGEDVTLHMVHLCLSSSRC